MKNRLDKELVNRNLAPSRSKSQELITSNLVKVGDKIISKANHQVTETDIITILENDKLKYVSRGGLKLEKAINSFNIDFKDLIVMDIGSSTGGFCDCALKHGAKKVIAIDVGTNLLHESLRNNEKIDLHEQTNFKELPHVYFEQINIITCDVSFISLKQIIAKIAQENIKIEAICLIKPQFEAGKKIASKYKGIILNKEIHKTIINDMINYLNSLNFFIKGLTSSPITGGDGNIEYLVYISNKVNKNIEVNINELVSNTFKSIKK